MDHVALKKALRKEISTARKALPREVVEQNSQAIFEKWRNRFSLRNVAWLHLFQSMAARNEVEMKYFEDFVRKKHSRVNIVIPIMDTVNDRLRHAHLTDDIELVRNKFGVPEPVMPVQFVYPLMLDMILVPLLGFDVDGNRLGYGKGYYDRFLHLTRPDCLKIGVSFELGKVEKVPTESHDVQLDFVVTEENIYRCNPNLNI